MNDKNVTTKTSESKKHFGFIIGKEQAFALTGLVLAFVVFIGFILIMYNNLDEKYQLELKFDSEKSFNSIYLALSDSTQKALRMMEDEKVVGMGIYGTGGQVFDSLGDAPAFLPMDKLISSKQGGQDSTLGLFIFDKDSRQIEYVRLSRLNIMFETGLFDVSKTRSAGFVDYPEIVYIKFDGEKYYNSVAKARIGCFIAAFSVACLFFVVLRIYLKNRKYRTELQKNENLAHLGAAARTLTHEIKNPLSAMTIQSALMRKVLPQEFSGDLDVMDHEIDRLTRLTNRVSEFLKNPVGNPEAIDLVPFITEIAGLFQRNIKLDFHGKPKCFVTFDPDRARSVIENLIKNAAESCLDRDPQVLVELKTGKRGTVKLMVKDRGDGLKEGIMDKIFDPFFTTKINGSGIGLSITKQFIEAQGGSLRLLPREGGGTVAEVVLKRYQEKAQ